MVIAVEVLNYSAIVIIKDIHCIVVEYKCASGTQHIYNFNVKLSGNGRISSAQRLVRNCLIISHAYLL